MVSGPSVEEFVIVQVRDGGVLETINPDLKTVHLDRPYDGTNKVWFGVPGQSAGKERRAKVQYMCDRLWWLLSTPASNSKLNSIPPCHPVV